MFTRNMTFFQKISPIHCKRKREGDFPYENTCTNNIKTNDQFSCTFAVGKFTKY